MPDEILKDRETLVLPEFTVGIHRLAYTLFSFYKNTLIFAEPQYS